MHGLDVGARSAIGDRATLQVLEGRLLYEVDIDRSFAARVMGF